MVSSSKLQLIAVVLAVAVVASKCEVEDLAGVAKLGRQLADPAPASPCYAKDTCQDCAGVADCEFCGVYIDGKPEIPGRGSCLKKGECATAKAGTLDKFFPTGKFELKVVPTTDARKCKDFMEYLSHAAFEYKTCETCKAKDDQGWCQMTLNADKSRTGGICLTEPSFKTCQHNDGDTSKTRLVKAADKCNAGFRPAALFTLPLLFATFAYLF